MVGKSACEKLRKLSFQVIYSPKLFMHRLTPCAFELAAVLDRIAKEQAGHAGGVLFLLDGSGSVYQSKQSAACPTVSPGTCFSEIFFMTACR